MSRILRDCSTKTTFNTNGSLACGPEGTLNIGGRTVPVCECKGQAGCQGPCYGIACPDGQQCVPYGRFAGECRPDTNCNFFGCTGGLTCHNGACVDDPRDPNPCQAGEVCKPNGTFTDATCTGSCADVSCQAGEVCKGGTCEPTGCTGDCCPAGQVCKGEQDAGFDCADSSCMNPFAMTAAPAIQSTARAVTSPALVCSAPPVGSAVMASVTPRPPAVVAPAEPVAAPTGVQPATAATPAALAPPLAATLATRATQAAPRRPRRASGVWLPAVAAVPAE
ncbi:MAG: hypothetical protein R3B07_31235 [Polyangiaceae bacterium]